MTKTVLIVLLLIGVGTASGVDITLLATNVSLPSPWTFYTGSDSPEGSWSAPWNTQASVSATVSLGQTLAPGDYSVYFKVLDYDHGGWCTFTMGGVTSSTNTFNDRDTTTIYWSTNLTVTTTQAVTNIIVDFYRNGGASSQEAKWMVTYITSRTNEIVLRDDRAIAFVPPTSVLAITNKGNIIPNSSFECGVDPFWRLTTLTRTNAAWELWETNVGLHGSCSIRLPTSWVTGSRSTLESNPFLVSSNRAHSLSVYARTTNGTSYAFMTINSVYTAPSGLTATYSSSEASITATNGWQRMPLSITNLPWYPSGEYYITLSSQIISATNVFFDGLQLEEGDLTAYAPRNDFEFAPVPSEQTRVFWNNDNTNTLRLRAYNNSGSPVSKTVSYAIRNNLNAIVDSGTVGMTVSSGATELSDPITLNTNRLGAFRAEFFVAGTNIENEITYGMIEKPASGIVESSLIGGHINPIHFTAQTAKRLGIKYDRSLSVGSSLARWSVVEATKDSFTWGDASSLTNADLIVMGVLGENLPTWMTNNNYFRTTNVVGAFTLGEQIVSGTTNGYASWIFYSTNAMGTALQVTNLTGNFSSGSVTGASSGATATILNSVFTHGLDWRRYTNYLANIFTHYSGIITNWEVWNEPDQDRSEMPAESSTWLGESYSEACRLAAVWANNIDPNIRLMFGGGVSTGVSLSNIWNRLGTYTNFHAWTVHHYSPNEGDLSGVINAFGKPIWNSETGTTDKGAFTGSRSSWRRAGKYVIGWKSGENMYSTLWENIRTLAVNFLVEIGYGQSKYFLYDVGIRNIGANDFESIQYSAWDYDDSIRAKGIWLASMGNVFGVSSGQGRLTLNDASSTAFGYLRGSTPLAAMWASTNKSITLTGLTTSNFKTVDMMGNRTTPSTLTVNFGRMPIILEGQGSFTYSNLVYSITNGTVNGRADTEAPAIAIVGTPRVTPADWATFRWVGIDDVSVPNRTEQEATSYSWNLNNSGWSDYSPNVYLFTNNFAGLTNFSVRAKDAAGNVSTDTVTFIEFVPDSGTNRVVRGKFHLKGNAKSQ